MPIERRAAAVRPRTVARCSVAARAARNHPPGQSLVHKGRSPRNAVPCLVGSARPPRSGTGRLQWRRLLVCSVELLLLMRLLLLHVLHVLLHLRQLPVLLATITAARCQGSSEFLPEACQVILDGLVKLHQAIEAGVVSLGNFRRAPDQGVHRASKLRKVGGCRSLCQATLLDALQDHLRSLLNAFCAFTHHGSCSVQRLGHGVCQLRYREVYSGHDVTACLLQQR